MDLLRGEVWDAHVRGAGAHPFVILTVNPVIAGLGAVTAALVTGPAGPRYTRVPLEGEADLTEYEESYADATDLHTIPQARFHRRRGRLAVAEMASLERAIKAYLGL